MLLPVLDDDKHYWVDEAEIEKLVRRGEGWLPGHPERELIVRRYLKNQASLFHPALARLEDEDDAAGSLLTDVLQAPGGRDSERARRRCAISASTRSRRRSRRPAPAAFSTSAAVRGPARAPARATAMSRSSAPMSRSARSEAAERRLKLDEMHDAQRRRIELVQSPLTYRDKRLAGFDAAALVEVIEHLDPPRLARVEENVFGSARPGTVVVTTPNAEYNMRWEALPTGEMRHADHRFEWTRAEFAAWADGVAERRGYAVRLAPVGPEDAEVGAPTQMAVFSR